MRQPRVFHLLQIAHSSLFRAADHGLKSVNGLSATQQAVLFLLLHRDGLPITKIADALNMGKSSLTGLVDRMVKRGLVTRSRNAEDRRGFDIHLTDKGRELSRQGAGMVRSVNARLLEGFSEAEWNVLERFLRHVADNAADIIQSERDRHLRRNENDRHGARPTGAS